MLSSARSRGIVLQPTPHPAYGSEFSTDGNRPACRRQARESLGRQWSRLPLYPEACKPKGLTFACFCRPRGRFPFPLPPRTIGEQKAKVKTFRNRVVGQFPVIDLPGTWT